MESAVNSYPICTTQYVAYGKLIKDYPISQSPSGCKSCLGVFSERDEIKGNLEKLILSRLGEICSDKGYSLDSCGKPEPDKADIQSQEFSFPVQGHIDKGELFARLGWREVNTGEHCGKPFMPTSVYAELKSEKEVSLEDYLSYVNAMTDAARGLVDPIITTYCRNRDCGTIMPFYFKCIGLEIPSWHNLNLIFADNERSEEARGAYAADQSFRGFLRNFELMHGETRMENVPYRLIRPMKSYSPKLSNLRPANCLYLSNIGKDNHRPVVRWTGVISPGDISVMSLMVFSGFGPLGDLVNVGMLGDYELNRDRL